jgi:hypothetical protein
VAAACLWNSSGPVNEPQQRRNVYPVRHCKVINHIGGFILQGNLDQNRPHCDSFSKIVTEVHGNNILQWCCPTFLYHHNVLYIIHQFQLKKK